MGSCVLVFGIMMAYSTIIDGAVYTRWGRTKCSGGDAELVYRGDTGGTWYDARGGGANYLCMPKDPQWEAYTDLREEYRAYVSGAEYEIGASSNFLFSPTNTHALHNHDVPCAVCRVGTNTDVVMIPARTQCYDGWTKQYQGYLMAEYHGHHRSQFICVDKNAEAGIGGHVDHNGALLYPVQAGCGSLNCPPYVDGRELTCVVCTK